MPDDPALRIFPDEYVPNAEGAEYHRRWLKANPAEASKWATFRDALIATGTGTPPSMATKYGRALVAAGKEHMSIARLIGQVTNPFPPPDPPLEPPPPPIVPPPPTGAVVIDQIADLNAVFAPDWKEPATSGVTRGSGAFQEISTPYGGGFRMVCSADMPSPWSTAADPSKLCLTSWLYNEQGPGLPLGFTEHWEFNLYFPTQTWVVDTRGFGFVGVFWEWHTNNASGHHVSMRDTGLFRIGRHSGQSGASPSYSFTAGPAVAQNVWIPVVIDIKWSQGADGFFRASIDGTQYVNFSGATDFNDGNPRLQFGWYSFPNATSEVRFGGVTMTRT